MSTGKSKKNTQHKPRRFLGAEYLGRKEVVRRSPQYHVTVSSIKQAFPKLRAVSAERIAISAFVEELDDTLHISEHIWHEVLPDLKHVTVVLDSAGPDVTESQTAGETPNLESSVPLVQQTPVSASNPVNPSANPPSEVRNTIPDTLPPQPRNWGGVDLRHIVIACYSGTKIWIMTNPWTTIQDLKAYIRTRLNLDHGYQYRFGGLDISDRRTVAELRLPTHSYNQILVTKIE